MNPGSVQREYLASGGSMKLKKDASINVVQQGSLDEYQSCSELVTINNREVELTLGLSQANIQAKVLKIVWVEVQ